MPSNIRPRFILFTFDAIELMEPNFLNKILLNLYIFFEFWLNSFNNIYFLFRIFKNLSNCFKYNNIPTVRYWANLMKFHLKNYVIVLFSRIQSCKITLNLVLQLISFQAALSNFYMNILIHATNFDVLIIDTHSQFSVPLRLT